MNNSSSKFDSDTIFKSMEPAVPPAMSAVGVGAYCTFMHVFTLFTAIVNIIVIVAFFKFRFLRKQSNVYIVSLACADIGVAVVVMPLHMYESWNGGWDLPHWFCYFRNIVDAGMCAVSTYNLRVLALDRYLAVCHPFVHMKISRTASALAIAFS
ncbi:tyramine receptor Ser-2-like [Gigantopelta aegis]|uniref:tyramine receptor Ser-2-like n=1 Tax=Gigantopelta aegis TaxID=1735272 RepID=UPI001B888CCC|nr:tyramine receptor Ser-2-like [Gigantopelta aegis]